MFLSPRLRVSVAAAIAADPVAMRASCDFLAAPKPSALPRRGRRGGFSARLPNPKSKAPFMDERVVGVLSWT